MAESLIILIVDDSLGERILMRNHLNQWKHKVDMAWDAESARELALMRRYDVILIDENLVRGSNCTELIADIHQTSVLNQDTPVMILTQKRGKKDLESCSVLQCVKPLSKQDTLMLIELVSSL